MRKSLTGIAMNKNKGGFTLIELLVVIAIIGLLSTLSILALNTARARARDVKRVADVKQIQTALEMYFNDTGVYPASALIVHDGSVSSTNGVYLKEIPTPPTPVDGASCPALQPNYTYNYTASTGLGGSYTIAYCLGSNVNDIPGNAIQYATPAGMR